MGTGQTSRWQKATGFFTRPLARRRHHHPPVDTLAQVMITTAAAGCTALAAGSVFGWMALPVALCTYLLQRHLLVKHVQREMDGLKPISQADLSLRELISPAPPLADDLTHTFLRHGQRNTEVGYAPQSYSMQVLMTQGRSRIGIDPTILVYQYNSLIGRHGQKEGVQHFARQFISELAHETSHLDGAPWLLRQRAIGFMHGMTLFTGIGLAGTGAASALIPAVTAPGLPTAAFCLLAVPALSLLNRMTLRIEEHRADRGSVLYSGHAGPLCDLLDTLPVQPVRLAFWRMAHPTLKARHSAMQNFASQLTDAERTAGQARVDRIIDEVSKRHPRLF